MNDVEKNDRVKNKAYRICIEFLGGPWEAISLDEMRFHEVRGGLSNKLYYCALPENIPSDDRVPKEALMRIYGHVQDESESRLQEISIFTLLSEKNLGPKLYGLFSDGRLEEYVPSHPLKWDNLGEYATSIAKEMAKIHALQLPIRKRPLFPIQTLEWLDFVEKNARQKPIRAFHDIIFSGEFRRDVNWLINQIEKLDSPVVFCNNDLQGGNILLMDCPRADGRNLMLIDFEFGGYNYRGFDLANHFNERCYDYSPTDTSFNCEVIPEQYPTESEQIEFIDAYLSQLQKEGVSFKNDIQTEKRKILRELPLLRLVVHLYWIIGCFKFDLVSSIDFPYLDLSESSWGLYKKNKEIYLKGLDSNDEQ